MPPPPLSLPSFNFVLFHLHRDAERSPELYLKAADCLQTLGEVGLESDNYQQAIDDFEACLRIQQEMLPSDSRAMAETNYHLGLSYSFVAKYDTSAAYFADSLQVRNFILLIFLQFVFDLPSIYELIDVSIHILKNIYTYIYISSSYKFFSLTIADSQLEAR